MEYTIMPMKITSMTLKWNDLFGVRLAGAVRISLYVYTVFLLFACGPNNENDKVMVKDVHSYAEPVVARVKHLTWTAAVDFESKTITGNALWEIETGEGAEKIVFDTKDLKIAEVFVDAKKVDFTLGNHDPILGQPLEVTITPDTKSVQIYYTTSPGAEALQWLTPQQTAGKELPFLFTQSQAILARTWVPCQDSPGIRFTYDAKVTVPGNLLALMSASNPQEKNATGVYTFEMKQPIPSYLLALAVGDLAFKPTGQRSGVYAEPSVIDTATWELADMEKMISGAESLYGPYQWDRYDVIMLPPSFPFGGMENPRLTFATPTILAGDRSLTSLVAHELAHSWSGNLVTNATWDDFWLNEGFTVYFESRIMEKLYGREYAEMLTSLEYQSVQEEIEDLSNKGLREDTKLKLNLAGRSPDDGVTGVAYNKGYLFLRSIEEAYGRDKFDAFLKDYFTTNAFHSMDTDGFIQYIKEYYHTRFNIALDDALFNEWIYSPGLPASAPHPTSDRFEKVDAVLTSWKEGYDLSPAVAKDWSTHEWLHFINNLPDSLSASQLAAVDNFGHFTASGNAEIIGAWGIVAIRDQYEKVYPVIESFLINTGRRKFLMPLYGELVKTPEGKARAVAIYKKARPNYHFVSTNSLDKLLL